MPTLRIPATFNLRFVLIGLFSLTLSGCSIFGAGVSDTEIPKYDVVSVSENDNIEIRRYDPMIIAEVEVQGERDEAISNGFRTLADYIFGNNTIQESIAMTAPVQQQASEKIAMTAPVQQQSSEGGWKVSFVMPSQYTMETLPKPVSEEITIKEIAATTFVVIKFSGFSSNENVAEHEEKLLQYIQANQLQILGVPKYAFYNPPWTLPFLRRNEIMVELAP